MNFKDYQLNEKASYNHSMGRLMGSANIPLTDKILKILGYGKKNIDTFHATSLEFLPNMKSLSKSKKTVSTFTKGLGDVIKSVSVQPEVIVKMNGFAALDANHDIFSHPDKQGRRWIGTRGVRKSSFFQEAILKKPAMMIKEMLNLDFSPADLEEWLDDIMLSSDFFEMSFDKLTGKQKSEVIKFYVDHLTMLLGNTMYSDIVKEILNVNKTNSLYDEILMNKFKILGVYSLEANRFKYDKSMAQYEIEKMGFKYLGHIPQDEFRKVSPQTH